MEKIIERPDATYVVIVEENGRAPVSIIGDDGNGFKTAQEAQARLKRIKKVTCNPFRPDISLSRKA
jgi:hypothetical protein